VPDDKHVDEGQPADERDELEDLDVEEQQAEEVRGGRGIRAAVQKKGPLES
jgi:hypothetical protein